MANKLVNSFAFRAWIIYINELSITSNTVFNEMIKELY